MKQKLTQTSLLPHNFNFTKHFFIFLIIVLGVTLIEFIYLGKPLTGIDDANIFLNYSSHFSHGEGFVYNTHGERVEGFTSMLWVLIGAGFFYLTAHPEIPLLILCLLLTTLTVTLVYREISEEVKQLNKPFHKKYLLWLYIVFIVCIGPSSFVWSVLSLMENALWNFLFITLIIIILQYSKSNPSLVKKIIACLLSILLTLTRPEAYAWNICFFALFLLIAITGKRKFFFPLVYLVVSVCTVIALFIFRTKYFGYPLPNTYYAKVSPDKFYNIKEGFIYAINFITGFHPVIIFFITAMAVGSIGIFLNNRKIIFQNKGQEFKILIVTLIVLIGLALPLITGGDHFGGFRFYQDVLLLSAWAIPAILILYKDVLNKLKYAILSALMIVTIFFLLVSGGTLFNLKHPLQTQLDIEFNIAAEQRKLAEEMNNFSPDTAHLPSVGVIVAGGFALKYHGFTIDLMGLNNTLMGHSSGDRIGIKNHAAFNKDVFYQLNPDVILPETVSGEKDAYIKYVQLLDEENFSNKAMKNIFNDIKFQQNYYPVIISNTLNGDKLFMFSNKNFFQKLQGNKLLQFKIINH